jgi:IS5 family transposase
MDDQIIAVYCLCADMLKALRHQEDPQCQMSDAEVLTTALVAVLHFRGNLAAARTLLREQGYIRSMLSESRFLRRLQRIRAQCLTLFNLLGETWKELNREAVYVIDSFPIPVCDNYRIRRAKLYHEERYRAYQASKKRYYFGLKLHLLVTAAGQPVEFFLTPASYSDVKGLRDFDCDLPAESEIYADKAYTDYEVEDVLQDADLHLRPMRKSNSKRPAPPWLCYLQARGRKIIETTGSLLERLLPKSIHAVTPQGFELKLVLFVVALSINAL